MTDLSGAVAPAAAMQRAIAVLAAVDRTQGLVEYDPDGRVLDANQNFLDLMGYTIEQIVGRDHRMFCTRDYINDEMYGDLWRAMTQGLAETGEYIRVTSSGKHVWLQGSYNPVFDDQGHVVKVIQLARDITDGKVRATYHDGKMAAINRLHAVVDFSTIFGYEGEDVLAPEYAEFWDKLAAGENHVGKFRHVIGGVSEFLESPRQRRLPRGRIQAPDQGWPRDLDPRFLQPDHR